jgi:ribonuclease D
MTVTGNERVLLAQHDLDPEFERIVREDRVVAWDLETSGLDPRMDTIAVCQLFTPRAGTQIVQVQGSGIPERLRELLISDRVLKVFHHAAFDLRFMRHHWKAVAHNVACTKILSKIVHPEVEPNQHSLKSVAARYLGVELDKGQRLSDWTKPDLSPEQLRYAARDVQFLLPLFERLMDEARFNGVSDVVERTFNYLPTRVETDLRGCGDVFAY